MSISDLMAAEESFQSFLEDDNEPETTSADVEAEISVKIDTEQTQPDEEVTEAEEEVTETAETSDEMIAHHDRLSMYHDAVERFGWSQVTASIIDPSGKFTAMYIPSMPGVESLDVVGATTSNETIAACEGFKEAMKKVWEWIKSTCAKILTLIKVAISKVRNLFSSLAKNVARVSKAAGEANLDEAKLKAANITTIKLADWLTLAKTVSQFKLNIAKDEPVTGAMKAFGINDDGSLSGSLATKLKGSESTIAASGWGSSSALKSAGDTALSLCKFIDSNFPAAAKASESAAQTTLSSAKKYQGVEGKEDKAKLEALKEDVKATNTNVRVMMSAEKAVRMIVKTYLRNAIRVIAAGRGKKAE